MSNKLLLSIINSFFDIYNNRINSYKYITLYLYKLTVHCNNYQTSSGQKHLNFYDIPCNNKSNLYTFVFLLQELFSVFSVPTDAIEDGDTDEPLTRVRRGGLSMLRLGRGLQMLRLGKRSMPMLRLGRSSLSALTSDELKYLLMSVYAEPRPENRRQVPLPRYGRADEELQMLVENILSQEPTYYYRDEDSPRQVRVMPRPGMRYKRSITDNDNSPIDTPMDASNYIEDKTDDSKTRSLPLPRFGRLVLDQERALPLPRFGKDLYDLLYALQPAAGSDINTADKRGMHMLRLGRAMSMLRLGKRPSPVTSGQQTDTEDKRSLSMLRLGKRLHMLRLGKRFNTDSNKESSIINSDTTDEDSAHNVETRAMHMLRLGRNSQ